MAECGDSGLDIALKDKESHEFKLSEARRFKTEGNILFKSKDIKKAIGKYHRALLYIKGLKSSKAGNPFAAMMPQIQESSVSEEIIEEAIKLQLDCHNNLAACLLLTKPINYEKVLHYCEDVLSIDDNNIKALYRKGVALFHLGEVESSLETLNTAKMLEGEKDSKIKHYITKCEQELTRQDRKMKETYKGMFDKMANTNDSKG